jgi:BlaI family transcriptional regulator, penicillinase repressor
MCTKWWRHGKWRSTRRLQVMAEKGLVRRDESERSHVYEAARAREWTQRQLAGELMERAFAGSAGSLLVGALAARKASRKELAEVRRLLDEYEKGLR